METVPKASQEMAAQIMDVYPYYGNYIMPAEHAEHLDEQAKAIKAEVEALRPYTMSDEQLGPKLTDIYTCATESGVWRADRGDGADERLDYAIQRDKSFGCTDEEAAADALRVLRTSGYLNAVRWKRKEQEQTFKRPVSKYIEDHRINADVEKKEIDRLLERTVDITTLSQAELAKLSVDFPSGNFLYHGSGTEQLVQILDTGILANIKVLVEQEKDAARAEGRETSIVRHNSGYEGVSWSMNGIDALPGDRYHMAGFIAAPETILGEGDQLAVPSRPSPNEVILIDGEIDVNDYYSAKTQVELYEAFNRNSVLSGLIEIKDGNNSSKVKEILSVLKDESFIKTLRDNYSVAENGAIILNPNLLSSADTDTEIPIAVVWLQGLVDSGRLKGTPFEGMNTAEVVSSVDDKNVKRLYIELHKEVDVNEEGFSGEVGSVAVPVEKMYFVAPRKDTKVWLKVMAHSPHKPAGILLYDDRKVRLENFASLHRGDQTELTTELQTAIRPTNEDYINYSEILGTEFTDDMRAGHRHQVIAEEYLTNRGAVKKVNGKLVVESKVSDS